MSFVSRTAAMARKRYEHQEIVAKFWQADAHRDAAQIHANLAARKATVVPSIDL
jgi:hypothetical protein